MPELTKRLNLVITRRQDAVLNKLCKKLLLNKSEVIRMAVARLAELENIKM